MVVDQARLPSLRSRVSPFGWIATAAKEKRRQRHERKENERGKKKRNREKNWEREEMSDEREGRCTRKNKAFSRICYIQYILSNVLISK